MVGTKLNFYLRRVYFLKICASVLLATGVTHNLCSQADSEIVLSIEWTSKKNSNWSWWYSQDNGCSRGESDQYTRRFAIVVSSKSRFSATFSSQGENVVQVSLASGIWKCLLTHTMKVIFNYLFPGHDRLVKRSSGSGFLAVKFAFFQVYQERRDFISDALMTSARPQTSFGKITFNPSWDNQGQGIFFTSNRRFLIMYTIST